MVVKIRRLENWNLKKKHPVRHYVFERILILHEGNVMHPSAKPFHYMTSTRKPKLCFTMCFESFRLLGTQEGFLNLKHVLSNPFHRCNLYGK